MYIFKLLYLYFLFKDFSIFYKCDYIKAGLGYIIDKTLCLRLDAVYPSRPWESSQCLWHPDGS